MFTIAVTKIKTTNYQINDALERHEFARNFLTFC